MNDSSPNLLSYNLFVELSQSVFLTLAVFLKTNFLGKSTGIFYIDSTPLRACHIKREHSNKGLKGLAAKGHCTLSLFFGLKIHFIINDKGEILDFSLTPGNANDRQPLTGSSLLASIYGKLFGDKGYLSQTLFVKLFIDGIQPITKLRKTMKKSLLHMSDKIPLRKRTMVETFCDEFKNICRIERTRHRSQEDFIINLLSGMIAYSYLPKNLYRILR